MYDPVVLIRTLISGVTRTWSIGIQSGGKKVGQDGNHPNPCLESFSPVIFTNSLKNGEYGVAFKSPATITGYGDLFT